MCGGHRGWEGCAGPAGLGGRRARRPSPWQRSPWQRWAGRALRPRRAELTSHKKSRPGPPSARSLRAGAQHHTSPFYWLVKGLAAPIANRTRPLPLLRPIAGRGRAAAGSVSVRCVRGPRAPRSRVAAEGRPGRGGLRGSRWDLLGSVGISTPSCRCKRQSNGRRQAEPEPRGRAGFGSGRPRGCGVPGGSATGARS